MQDSDFKSTCNYTRRRYYVDGGVAAFIPRPPTPTAVRVSCIPISQLLARVQPSVQVCAIAVAAQLTVLRNGLAAANLGQ
jgi:hypothetical protein